MATEYQKRVIAQAKAWVSGESNHNDVDNECCPDFSCCEPAMFEQDRAKRIDNLNRYLRKVGQPLHMDA